MRSRLCAALYLAILTLAASAAEKVVFTGLTKAQHLAGSKIGEADLRGKVIFLEYWGVNCPPCRASFPHLVDLQKKFGRAGNFTVLASHVQADSKAAAEFCQKAGVNFPVFHQFWLPSPRPAGAIPFAALIDHTGAVIAQGLPAELFDQVAKAVRNAPAAGGILAGLELKHWKAQAKQVVAGKPLLSALKAFQSAAERKDEKADEAREIVKAIEAYVQQGKQAVAEQGKTRPAAAYFALTALLVEVKGMDCEPELQTLFAELKKDPSVPALAKLMQDSRKVQAQTASANQRREQDRLRSAMLKLAGTAGQAEVIRQEAEEFAKAL